MAYNIRYAGISHTGLCRRENQDNLVCDGRMVAKGKPHSQMICGETKVRDGAIFGVFDGMGGLPCGETASMIAAQNATGLRLKKDTVKGLYHYCGDANREICEYGTTHHLRGLGTTAAVLAFSPREIGLCNIGDSKIFRISQNRMEQISKDHVLRCPSGRRYLTQNLGVPEDLGRLEPYFARGQYQEGDRYLICSDGLTDMVSQREIMRIVRKNPFQHVVPALLKEALRKGGRDNVTIVLCEVLHRIFG